jgi:bifunctional non-homologous end joining protein LigD
MALEEYRRKRDFKKTTEPAGGERRAAKGFSYLIQKHDATRLHYDLRLELDGVLLSWAVTKGPSLDPADRRLAVHTEDHPLSYGTFEGTIPQGEYGGGTVMLWDRGGWEPQGDPRAGLRKGHLAFTLHGERLTGGWDLIRMGKEGKKENWLLIKKKDDAARAAAAFLETENTSISTGRSMDEIALGAPAAAAADDGAPNASLASLLQDYPDVQLATLVDRPPVGAEWLHEIKFDGYRLLGYMSGKQARLVTRNGNDWTRKFPGIYAAVSKLKARACVLDMEAVVLDAAGKSSFQAMQRALGEGGDAQSIQAFVFDLLHLDGKDLRGEPLTKRKEALRKLLTKSGQEQFLHYSDHIAGQGSEMLAKSCGMGLEGIVSKLADSRYSAGRSKSWLKAKCILRQEFVIVGYTAAKSGSRAIGALHLGYSDKGGMKYAGKVGTGFGMKDAEDLYARLAPLKTGAPPVQGLPRGLVRKARWVRPVLLCEVSFTEWTEDGHIRHPSFQGLREDKNPKEVTMEKPAAVKGAPAAKKKNDDRLDVLGVSISHPGRVIFEDTGVTKGQLAEFYAAASKWMLKDFAGHPVSLLRCPEGTKGDCFYQRSPGMGLGKDVRPFRWKHKGKSYEYLYIEDEKGIVEFAQMGAIELHPWGAKVKSIDYPDRMIFDLDPDEGVPFDAVKLAAQDLRKRLKRLGLESYLKCTGGKGLHVRVPLAEKNNWEEVKAFCADVAETMVREVPDAYVATMSKAKRKGKIFVDYFRNDYTATAIADYSVRARAGAPVAVPLEWRELDSLRSASQFTITDVLKRLKAKPPNMERYEDRQKLPG